MAPYVRGWIAAFPEDLTTRQEETVQAHMTLMQHTHWRRCRHEARMELRLAAKTLQATSIAKTPSEAVFAALKLIERRLHEV